MGAIKKHNMLEGASHIVCALSGGADSVAMLYELHGMSNGAYTLSAMHLNHKFRGDEAERDAAHCADICSKLGIPFALYEREVTSIASSRGISFETAGRELRYELLEEERVKYGDGAIIATAHTASDTAETLLLNLMRGTGLAGLSGIAPIRGSIIRPIIYCLREDVEAYCKQKGIEYVDDSTNFTPDYARNRIRLEMIPYMKEHFNPKIVESLGRTAELLRVDEEALSTLAADEGNIAELLKMPKAVMSRSIRKMAGIQLTKEQTEQIIKLCKRGGNGICRSLPRGLVANVAYGKLHFSSEEQYEEIPLKLGENEIPHFGFIDVKITSEKVLKNVYNITVKCDIMIDALCVRSRKIGEGYRPYGRPEKSLARMAKDAKIPLHLREGLPVITAGGEIVAAYPFGPSQDAAAEGEAAILITYRPKEAYCL